MAGELKFRVARIARDANRSSDDACAAPERQIDRGPIPGIELDAPVRRDRDRQNHSARQTGQLDDSQAADAGDTRYIGGERNIVTRLERIEHLPERADAALAI